MTAIDFINNIRYKIGDTQKKKYTDDRLLGLINEGLMELNSEIPHLFYSSKDITIVANQRSATISNDIIKIHSVSSNKATIPIIPYRELDNKGDWGSDIGSEIECVVVDETIPGTMLVYPLLDEGLEEVLTITYSSIFPDINFNDDIPLPYIAQNTLLYYVAGVALLDDTRTEVLNKASIFIDKYKISLFKIRDIFNIGTDYYTKYTTGFNNEF